MSYSPAGGQKLCRDCWLAFYTFEMMNYVELVTKCPQNNGTIGTMALIPA